MIYIDGYAFWVSIGYSVKSENYIEDCKAIHEQVEAQMLGWA